MSRAAGVPGEGAVEGQGAGALAGLADGIPPGPGLALEVGTHSEARAAAFAAAGWSYVTMDGVDGAAGVTDPRHRLRGTLEAAAYLPGEAFDAVLLVGQLERSQAPWEAAAQVRRILKPGGWVYVETGAARPAGGDPEAPWSLGPAALRALFQGLDERAGTAGGDGVRYVAVKPVPETVPAVAAEGACPVCGGAPEATGERQAAFDEPLLACTACGHAFVRAGGPAAWQPPQSRARIDFYVLHVLRHLPVASVLDLHPTPGDDLLRALADQLPGVRGFAIGARPPEGGGDVGAVATPAGAGRVDMAVGLLALPFLAASELGDYVREVARLARWFVFEVPVGDDPDGRRAQLRDSTQRQFFSRRSLERLFAGTGARVHAMVGFGPRRAPVLVAYRLPAGAVMSNGLVLDAD